MSTGGRAFTLTWPPLVHSCHRPTAANKEPAGAKEAAAGRRSSVQLPDPTTVAAKAARAAEVKARASDSPATGGGGAAAAAPGKPGFSKEDKARLEELRAKLNVAE